MTAKWQRIRDLIERVGSMFVKDPNIERDRQARPPQFGTGTSGKAKADVDRVRPGPGHNDLEDHQAPGYSRKTDETMPGQPPGGRPAAFQPEGEDD